MKLKYTPAQVKKAAVAVATGISQALALGLLPAPFDKYAVLALAILGAYGVFAARNADAPAGA